MARKLEADGPVVLALRAARVRPDAIRRRQRRAVTVAVAVAAIGRGEARLRKIAENAHPLLVDAAAEQPADAGVQKVGGKRLQQHRVTSRLQQLGNALWVR